MNASILASDARAVSPARRTRLVSSRGAWRALLLAGCAALGWAVPQFCSPSTLLQADPELAQLLRGMAAIKALLVVATIAILVWRFGHGVTMRIAGGYVVGAWLIVGATLMIWQLSFIIPAAAIFHLGAVMLLVLAWRDDGVRIRRFGTRGERIAASRHVS